MEVGGTSPPQAQRNIKKIAKIELEALQARSFSERLSDHIARIAGQIWFIFAHALWFVAWALVNDNQVPGFSPFDPFPYPFLTLVVSLEAIFLSLFILRSQSRANRHADRRAHLDLQINLLAEAEMTKILQMLQALCGAQGLSEAKDPVVQELQAPTAPEDLLRQIKKTMPPDD